MKEEEEETPKENVSKRKETERSKKERKERAGKSDISENKNRLCSKTCGMDMNAERRKIRKNMKIPRER